MMKKNSENSSISLTALWDATVRSFILPIGPSLVSSIIVSKSEVYEENFFEFWAQIGLHWGYIYSIYMVGRFLGNVLWPIVAYISISERNLLLFGVILTSLLQAFLAFTNSIKGVLLSRFMTGFVCCIVCKIVGNPDKKMSTSSNTYRASIAWSLGLIIGPLIGGTLYGYPSNVLLFKEHPDAYPCLAVGLFVCLLAFVRLTFMNGNKISNDGFISRRRYTVEDIESANKACLENAENVPNRYVRVFGNKASEKWKDTCIWRRDNMIDNVLKEKQPHFNQIKKYYPHFFHGRSRDRGIVCWENPSKMNFSALFNEGVLPYHLQRHFCFVNEYVWTTLCPGSDDQLMTVLDVNGLGMSTLKNNTIMHQYMRAATEVMQSHYPDRQRRIILINAPWWFAGVYKKFSGILSTNTTSKLQICGTDFLPTLRMYIPNDQIPRDYGGASPFKLGESLEEKGLVTLKESLDNAQDPSWNVSSDSSNRATQYQQLSTTTEHHRVSWISSWMSSKSDQAFLGNSNQFYYDSVLQMWVLQNEQDVESNTKSSTSSNLTEEDILIKAIQASEQQKQLERLRSIQLQIEAATPRRKKVAGSIKRKYRKMESIVKSSILFTCVLLQYMLWCATQAVMEMAISYWALSPNSLGGLALSPKSVGWAIALAGICLAAAHGGNMPSRLAQMPIDLPLRTIRLVAASQFAIVISMLFISKLKSIGWTVSILALTIAASYICTTMARTSSSILLQVLVGTSKGKIGHFPGVLRVVRVTSALGETCGPMILVHVNTAALIGEGSTLRSIFSSDTSLQIYLIGASCAILYILAIALQFSGFGESVGKCDSSLRKNLVEGILEIPLNDIESVFGGKDGIEKGSSEGSKTL